MKALILAAGYATRLYPLTKEYPKPLLEVNKRPIIDYIVDKLETIGQIDEIIVVTNDKFFLRFKKWAKNIKTNKRITLVNDFTKSQSDRRGAIGDMDFVIEKRKIKDDLLVIGGDNIFDADLGRFLSFARGRNCSPSIGTYYVKNLGQAKNYGVVKMNAQKRLIDFKEKPRSPQSRIVAMCMYYFPKPTLGLIAEFLETKPAKADATGFYIDWLRRKTAVYGFVFDGCWYDIGDYKYYNKAKVEFTG